MIDDEAINELINDVELLKSQVLALPGTEISDLKNDIRELNDAIKRIDEEEIIALRKEVGQLKELNNATKGTSEKEISALEKDIALIKKSVESVLKKASYGQKIDIEAIKKIITKDFITQLYRG